MRRILTTEWLDLGGTSDHEVADDLGQIRWINRHCGGTRLLLKRLQQLIDEDGWPPGPLRILDVATGSADLPSRVVEWAAARRRGVLAVGIDRNPVVLRVARAQVRAFPQIRLVRADARALPLRSGSFDYALCSLFVHQLPQADGAALLRDLLRVARRAVLINDLRRHPLHYAAAWALARALTRNRITRNDAPASVRNAYTAGELRALGEGCGASRVELWRHAPFRACMVLRP